MNKGLRGVCAAPKARRVGEVRRIRRWHFDRRVVIKIATFLVKGLLLEVRLGHFIGCPADSSTRHGGDDARTHTTEETTPTEAVLDNGSSVPQAAYRANFLAFSQTASLEKSLHDIEGSSDTRCEGTGKTTCHAVSERVVILLGVHEFRDRLVGNELGSCEGHCHAEGGRIGEVECLETLSSVKGFGALHQGLVDGAVDLHSLLDNIEWIHQCIACDSGRGTT